MRDNLRLGVGDDRAFEASLADISGWFPVLTARLSQRAGTLSGGEQKMLIVARGLIAKPRPLLLDEVTEGLQPSVVDRLSEVLAATRRDRGTAMLVVEQHLSFVLALADRFAVLKRGEVVDTGQAMPVQRRGSTNICGCKARRVTRPLATGRPASLRQRIASSRP